MERDGDRVLELFFAAVDESGGPGRMLREHRAGWMPHLMASACALVLQEEEHRDPQEIASFLGATSDTVENVLAGPGEEALTAICGLPPGDETTREQISGAVVRHAWKQSVATS